VSRTLPAIGPADLLPPFRVYSSFIRDHATPTDRGTSGGPAARPPRPPGSTGRCPPVCQCTASGRAAPLCLHRAGPAAAQGPVQRPLAAPDASHCEAGYVQLGLGEW
jgi:hypothetical protein